MYKRLFSIPLTLILLIGTTLAVSAETATVTVTGGSLSATIANVTLSGATLDGTDLTATSASGSNSWTAVDARGTGLGWNLTILGENFSDGASHTIDITAADSKFQIQLLDANIGVAAGNTKPTSSVTTLTDIPTVTPLKFVSAAVGDGMGSYTLAPNFSLMVPAETYAGTYTSTITVTAVSGP